MLTVRKQDDCNVLHSTPGSRRQQTAYIQSFADSIYLSCLDLCERQCFVLYSFFFSFIGLEIIIRFFRQNVPFRWHSVFYIVNIHISFSTHKTIMEFPNINKFNMTLSDASVLTIGENTEKKDNFYCAVCCVCARPSQ